MTKHVNFSTGKASGINNRIKEDESFENSNANEAFFRFLAASLSSILAAANLTRTACTAGSAVSSPDVSPNCIKFARKNSEECYILEKNPSIKRCVSTKNVKKRCIQKYHSSRLSFEAKLLAMFSQSIAFRIESPRFGSES
uniref:Uncharacterized protein n=1 Tax=Romanomermis culicivorax TaxID=13658 RepID=A0A915KB83_ROMCU